MDSSNSQNREDLSADFKFDDSTSIDDFIRELEAKEKDLDISSELIIEIDETDLDDHGAGNLPDFLKAEFAPEPIAATAPTTAAPVTNYQPHSMNSVATLETQVSELQAQISRAEIERADLAKLMQRRQTDFENYKKRVERERSETYQKQLGNLAAQMLPVLDNMNRALDLVSNLPDERQDIRHFFDGIMLVNQQLNEVLAEMGVQPIAAVGEPFDPHFHEAVAAEETDEVPPGTVTAEFLRGYRIDDKVVRAAMVKVSKLKSEK